MKIPHSINMLTVIIKNTTGANSKNMEGNLKKTWLCLKCNRNVN